MDLREVSIKIRNWVDLVQDGDYWRALVNVGIEPPGSISHGVSLAISCNLYHDCDEPIKHSHTLILHL